MLYLQPVRKCDTLWVSNLWIQSFLWFADLKLHQVCKYKLSPEEIAKNALITICALLKKTFRTVLRQSCAIFSQNWWICDWRTNHKICRFLIFRLAHLGNLWTAIAELAKELVDLWFADFKKNVCLSTYGTRTLNLHHWRCLYALCAHNNIDSKFA